MEGSALPCCGLGIIKVTCDAGDGDGVIDVDGGFTILGGLVVCIALEDVRMCEEVREGEKKERKDGETEGHVIEGLEESGLDCIVRIILDILCVILLKTKNRSTYKVLLNMFIIIIIMGSSLTHKVHRSGYKHTHPLDVRTIYIGIYGWPLTLFMSILPILLQRHHDPLIEPFFELPLRQIIHIRAKV